MKDQLLSVAAYIESLEQRIAALEARCDTLENELKQRPASVEDEDEPEVEEELIVEEDEQENGPEDEIQQQEPETEETVNTDAPADSQTPESKPEPEPEQEQELEQELVIDQQPVQEPAPQPQLARVPQQTSLFGAPVSDIRQAISIGDRFLFQRELFGGNGETMQKLLERINACAGLGEAMDIVELQAWDRESPTYELFINVLRRRFQS